jgi:hypothetical protein
VRVNRHANLLDALIEQLFCVLLFVVGVCVFGTIISETNGVLEEFKVQSLTQIELSFGDMIRRATCLCRDSEADDRSAKRASYQSGWRATRSCWQIAGGPQTPPPSAPFLNIRMKVLDRICNSVRRNPFYNTEPLLTRVCRGVLICLY